ncbi:DUF2177 family protein [Roseibium suaedae]|uniref:Uncharacterized membrane protein n=1 Tax=Roseibium suaedae TaxID=735517 RepID=A0A1M7HSI8_9HYPH|nr:Uncharacterized membrane protein [Roseibium suaedae]
MVMQYVIAYLTTAAVFLALDFIWLSKVATKFYFDRLGHLLMEKPNLAAAALFYAVYVVGLVIFAIGPAVSSGRMSTALVYGVLFGFFTYATYDMTNYATLRGWPVAVVVLDIAWGMVISGVSAVAGYYLTRLIIAS